MNRAYDTLPRRPSQLAFDVSRIVVDVGVLLVLGAMSLPFVTGDGFRQRALAGDGLVALLLVAPVFVMTVLPDQSRPLPRPLALVSLLLAGAALPYTVVKYLDASTLAGTVRGTVGMGARLLVIGAFTVLGGLVLGLVRGRLQPQPEATGAEDLRDEPRLGPDEAPLPRFATPWRQPGPAASPAPGPARAPQPGPAPARAFPRWKRPGAAHTQAPPAQPAPAGGRAPAPSSRRSPTPVAPQPRQADPDTGPTLPAQRPVQPWWPDDLDDLFS